MFKFSSLLQTIGVIIGVFLATIANANGPAIYNIGNTIGNIKHISKNLVTTDLKGKVVEKGTNAPVGYATIAIYTPDKKLITGATTEDDGTFTIPNAQLMINREEIGKKESKESREGKMILEVSFIGYHTLTIPLTINGNSNDELGKSIEALSSRLSAIEIEPDAEMLKGATVTAKRPLIEQKLDKVIMNVSESVFASTSNGMEMLKKAPGITVDKDGNIKLNGQGVEIWVDDRPSNLQGTNLETLLSALQGSAIEKIEIMQHPSAKYDAQGSAGIINIKTKRSFTQGLYGNINAGYGISPYSTIYNSYRGNANVNYKTNKTNSYIITSYNTGDDAIDLKSMTLFGDNYNYKQESESDFAKNDNNFNIRMGTDINITQKDIIGGLIGYYTDSEDNNTKDSYTKYYNLTTNKLTSRSVSDIQLGESNNRLDANFYYTKMFDQYSKLTINADYSYYDANNKNKNQLLTYTPDNNITPANDTYYMTNLDRYLNIYALKADYRMMLGKTGTLETGAKWARTTTFNKQWQKDSVGRELVINPQKANDFNYYETVSAAYASVSMQFNEKWSMMAGLRAEYTYSKGDWKTSDKKTKKDYLDLFPTIYIGYQPSTNYRLALSYTRRLQRPWFSALNPAEFTIDATTILKGNPNVNPSYTNNISLTFGYKSWLNVSLLASMNKKSINQIVSFDETTGNKTMTWDNWGRTDYFGGNISLSEITVVKDVVYFSANAFLSYVINKDLSQNMNERLFFQNYYGSLTFILPKEFKFEANCHYKGKAPYSNMYADSNVYLDFGAKKECFNKKLIFSVNATDPFRQNKQNISMKVSGKETYSVKQNYYSQNFKFGVTWRFGSIKAQNRTNERDDTSERAK
ncbi:MAG: TonB-dependent receptor [Bacteroidales bacterium]|nr:TonB-dependent receptor [Bacteroidales bacterium]